MRRKTITLPLLFAVVILIASGFSGRSASAQEKTTKKFKDTCITSECHAAMGKEKFVHGPVAAVECTVCHGKSPKHKEKPEKYKFSPIKDVAGACYSCHEKFKTKKFTHTPFAEGECISCHSPHGSPNKFQLLAKGGKLCFNCHDEELVEGKFVHGPAAVGGCVACHDPHTADYAKNLRAEPPNLCFMCHTDKAEAIRKAEFVHTPVSENCTKCHNPHSAAKQFMLESNAPELCLNCHKDKKKQLSTAAVKHGAIETKKSCLNCHDVHMSDIAKNLIMEPMDLCLSCHDREYKRDVGKSLMNMKKWLAENKDHHGPIKQKDCSGCHNPHGSNNFRILRNPYPPTFYKPFAVENYNLCFSCHEKSIVLNPETTKLTNFRNGNENLHFKHVNKPIKGRTCRACHETHASNSPKHIREAVPFGSWQLPLNYQKTKTGGSCMPGCHKLKKYDRVKPVKNQG
ncbi:MAG TPA: cytochrome C [Nitrospirae bacterium]|nr:high-molecular-weight cytochrome c precursor [bacterium BMS3Abin06]HDH12473.1 cytochrome C [Nitrospirota bacterium]HDZ02390.1 cytochrome C [Nitrospirota bacterium]